MFPSIKLKKREGEVQTFPPKIPMDCPERLVGKSLVLLVEDGSWQMLPVKGQIVKRFYFAQSLLQRLDSAA